MTDGTPRDLDDLSTKDRLFAILGFVTGLVHDFDVVEPDTQVQITDHLDSLAAEICIHESLDDSPEWIPDLIESGRFQAGQPRPLPISKLRRVDYRCHFIVEVDDRWLVFDDIASAKRDEPLMTCPTVKAAMDIIDEVLS